MTPSDFADAVAYELHVLGSVINLISKTRGVGGLDLDSGTASIQAGSAGGRDLVWARRMFAPLLLGAAWKILDVTIEYILLDAGIRRPGDHWPIGTKLRAARDIAAPSYLGCWPELVELYDATTGLRHSVVHRRIAIDSSFSISGFTPSGVPLASFTSISEDELVAFCRFAQRVATLVQIGTAPARDVGDARAQLAALAHFLGVGASAPAPQAGGVLALRLKLPADRVLRLPEYLARGKRVFPTAQWFDLAVDMAEHGVWTCELETEVSRGDVTVDLSSIPTWLRQW